MSYMFKNGQQPLEGYTIKRGVGRGGFGEVYFAASDAGKEVALKLIRRNLEVELRGVTQCLNLKHPNLIDLYDIRTDEHGRPLGGHGVRRRANRSRTCIDRHPAAACRSTWPWTGSTASVAGVGLPARSRHRPPRPEAGQHLPRRTASVKDRRLRPVQVHLVQPPQRPDRERRHRPLHGAGNRQRPLRPQIDVYACAASCTRCSPAACRSRARRTPKCS